MIAALTLYHLLLDIYFQAAGCMISWQFLAVITSLYILGLLKNVHIHYNQRFIKAYGLYFGSTYAECHIKQVTIYVSRQNVAGLTLPPLSIYLESW